jgi:hypothetical protein
MTMSTVHGAVVMNKNTVTHSNTVMMSFNWHDFQVRSLGVTPEQVLAGNILAGVLPAGCRHSPVPCSPAAPTETRLHPGVPNPFNPTTTLQFELASSGHVRLKIFDVAGRLVRSLVDAPLPAGSHIVRWSGDDDRGRHTASGVYFCRLDAGGIMETRTLVLVE